jgi:ATP-dependent Clp protease ATP-binding subunit ClpA
MEKFSVSRLIGAPPGYVGYESGGLLTEPIRRRPYQVILLDEFEKAHPEVSNLLLQVFDDGILTDSHGNTVDYRNTIIIMTSNLGAEMLISSTHNDDDDDDEFNDVDGLDDHSIDHNDDNKIIKSSKEMQLSNIQLKKKEMKKKKKRNQMMDIATQLVHKKFSPEFVNRIDDIIIFNQLQNDAIMKICELQINGIKKILHKKMIKMLISVNAIQHLADCGTDVKYGARPLKRLIQRVILNPLSNCILEVMTDYFCF